MTKLLTALPITGNLIALPIADPIKSYEKYLNEAGEKNRNHTSVNLCLKQLSLTVKNLFEKGMQ